jgi:hypothetical protein
MGERGGRETLISILFSYFCCFGLYVMLDDQFMKGEEIDMRKELMRKNHMKKER